MVFALIYLSLHHSELRTTCVIRSTIFSGLRSFQPWDYEHRTPFCEQLVLMDTGHLWHPSHRMHHVISWTQCRIGPLVMRHFLLLIELATVFTRTQAQQLMGHRSDWTKLSTFSGESKLRTPFALLLTILSYLEEYGASWGTRDLGNDVTLGAYTQKTQATAVIRAC